MRNRSNPIARDVYKRFMAGEDVGRQRHLVDVERRTMHTRRIRARRVLHAVMTRGIA